MRPPGGSGGRNTCGRARTGAEDLRRPAAALRATPWRTPPELALHLASGELPGVLAVLRMERRRGDPQSFCMDMQAQSCDSISDCIQKQ